MELDEVNYKNAAGELKTNGKLSVVKTKTGVVKVVVGSISATGRFVAKSGAELRNYLATIVNKPLGKLTMAIFIVH